MNKNKLSKTLWLKLLTGVSVGMVIASCHSSGSSSGTTDNGGISSSGANTLTMMSPRVSTSNLYPAHGFFIIANNTDKPVLDVKYSVTNPTGDGAKSVLNTDSANACATVAAYNECILTVDTPNTSGPGSYTLTATNSKGALTSDSVSVQNGVFNDVSGSDGVSLNYNTTVAAGQRYVVVTGLVTSQNTGKFNNAVLVDNAGNALPNQQSISGNLGNDLQYLRTGDTFAIAMPVPAGVGSTQNFKLQLNTLDEKGDVSDIINGVSTYAVTTVATAAEAQAANKLATKFSLKAIANLKFGPQPDCPATSPFQLDPANNFGDCLCPNSMPATITGNTGSCGGGGGGGDGATSIPFQAALTPDSQFYATTMNSTISRVLTIRNNNSAAKSFSITTLPAHFSLAQISGVSPVGNNSCTVTNGLITNLSLAANTGCDVNLVYTNSTVTASNITPINITSSDSALNGDITVYYQVTNASTTNKLSLAFDSGIGANNTFAANSTNPIVSHTLTIQNLNSVSQVFNIAKTTFPSSGFAFQAITTPVDGVSHCTVDADGNNVSGTLTASGVNNSCDVNIVYTYTYGMSAITNSPINVTNTTTPGNSNSINISTTYTPGQNPIGISLGTQTTPAFSVGTDGSVASQVLTLSNPNQDTQNISLTLPTGFSFNATETNKQKSPCTVSGNAINNMQLLGNGQCQAVINYASTTAISMQTANIQASDSTNSTQSNSLPLTYQVNQDTANLAISLPQSGNDFTQNFTNLLHLYSGILNNNNDSVKFIANITNSGGLAVTGNVTLSSGIEELPITISGVSNGNTSTTGCSTTNIPANGLCKVTLQLGPTKKAAGSYSFLNASLKYNNKVSEVTYKLSNLFPAVANVNVIAPNSAAFSVAVSGSELGSGDGTQSKPYQINTGGVGTLTLTVKNVGTGTNATANSFYIAGTQLAGFDSTQSTCKTASTSNITFVVGNTCTLVYKVAPKTSRLATFDFSGLKYTYTADGSTKSSSISQQVYINFVKPFETYFKGYYPNNCVPNGMTKPSNKAVCECIKDPTTKRIWTAVGPNNAATIGSWNDWRTDSSLTTTAHCGLTGGWSLPSALSPSLGHISSSNPGGDWGAIATAAGMNGNSFAIGTWMNNNGFKDINTVNYYWSSQSIDILNAWCVNMDGYVYKCYKYLYYGVLLVHP